MAVDLPATGLEPEIGQDDPRRRNVPSPLLSAVHTPVSPNPTMSARPSPVMSTRKRGLRSTRKRADSGPTASDGMQHPPMAPGTPN